MYPVVQNGTQIIILPPASSKPFVNMRNAYSTWYAILRECEMRLRYEKSKTVRNGLAWKAVCKAVLIVVDDGEAHSATPKNQKLHTSDLKML